MWSFLAPLLIGRATGRWRYIRVALAIILVGCAIAGLVYAAVVFNAVLKTSENHHVQQYSAQ